MPIYSFRCFSCDARLDEMRSVERRRDPIPCVCGGQLKRVPEQFKVDTFEPYYDEALDADISSRRERRAGMRGVGVV